MNTDFIFNCQNDTEFDTMSGQVQAIIRSLGSEWPDFPMVGTQTVAGRKLLHVRMTQLLPKAVLEGMFAAHNLDWQVLSIRSAYKDGSELIDGVDTPCYITEYQATKADFLPYLNPVWDSVSETFVPVTLADTVYLSAYAGTESIQL